MTPQVLQFFNCPRTVEFQSSLQLQSPKDIFKPKIFKIRDIKSNRGKDTRLRLNKSILCQSTQKAKEQLAHIDSSKVAAYYLVLFGPKGRKSNFLSGHNLRFFVNTVFHSPTVEKLVDTQTGYREGTTLCLGLEIEDSGLRIIQHKKYRKNNAENGQLWA